MVENECVDVLSKSCPIIEAVGDDKKEEVKAEDDEPESEVSKILEQKKDTFLAGCVLNGDDVEIKAVVEARRAEYQDAMRDAENFDWVLREETFEGMTLKHAVDMMGKF